ncbi:ATP-binding protein [Mucilaginibacter arboris]|uniref:ATP-binding protein n=1 Tax=Mucilaginibacter arboris TaxID=2682090 RepID=UPI0018DC5656|nr:ATP-binding protein [Mucilaginibacter arboris]
MRYLNKIVFINSAGMPYADISIDGNVHFIGTQGVGKSTTLRAILFFYNVDKLKLGIEKGKRTFDEYYFPYGNSFIVYEVARESGPFCVLAFKSQGRVAFRFIEGSYNKDNYINPENKAMSWEQIRGTFSGTNTYTRKIERYEEYRDILYGNNKGLSAEFRKYALIESRQYQNLPRTIQNVFLNSKLEAEFIKQTIIMSLNEEDIKIDLAQYELHLKDFEVQLDDISKWSIKNRSGEVVARLIADAAKDEKQVADEQIRVLTNQVKNQVEVKKKERDNKISRENTILQETLNKLSEDIKSEAVQVQTRINDIQQQASRALEHAGADTMRLNAIDQELVAIVEELQFIENNRQTVSEYGKDKRELFDLVDKFKSDKKIYENQLAIEKQRHELAKGKLQELVIKRNHIIAGLDASQRRIEEDILTFDNFSLTEVFSKLDPSALIISESVRTTRRVKDLIDEINDKSFSVRDKLDDLLTSIQKFLSHFSSANIFGFKTNLIETSDFFLFAENLKEFLEEDKIAEFEKRTNERFASLIFQIGKETTDLVSKEATIQKVISDINKDFEERNFTGVIKSINLRLSPSANKIVMLLTEIRKFNDEHALSLGKSNLFTGSETEQINKKAVGYLKNFANEITSSKLEVINLSDTFELQFKVVENDNDSGWVEKLTNVGSEGDRYIGQGNDQYHAFKCFQGKCIKKI